MTPLEDKLSTFLIERDLLHPDVPSLLAAKEIIQWMVEEYDRQVDEALNAKERS